MEWCSSEFSRLFFSCDQAALWMVFSVRLSVISRLYKSLLRSQIYHGYEELSTDKNYPIWRRQVRRSKYAVQLASWQLRSNSPKMSVRHTFLTMFPSSYHHEIFRSYYQWQKWRPCKTSRSEVKSQGHTALKSSNLTQIGRFRTVIPVWIHQYSNKMMHKAWSSMEEVPYCFSRSSVKLQGHTALKKRPIWPKLGVSGL